MKNNKLCVFVLGRQSAHVCAVPAEAREGVKPLELELQGCELPSVGAGNLTVLWKSNKHSQLLSQLSSS